jgi:hypothetical protein
MKKELQVVDLPVACTLQGRELQERKSEVSKLFAEVQETIELEDGFSYKFGGSPEIAQSLADFVLFERGCCRFFTFELHFEPGFGAIWLSVRGSAEAKQFLRQ